MGLPRLWSKDEIAARILAGETLVILHNNVIRVPQSWLAAHPGGELAILHFVGRDAADEVTAYHSDQTLNRMKAYVVGTLDLGPEGWIPLVPPVMAGWLRSNNTWHADAAAVRSPTDSILLLPKSSHDSADPGPTSASLRPPPTTLSPALQAQHSAAYKALHQRVKDAGLFDTRYLAAYGPECIRYTLLAISSALAYRAGWFIPSAIALGFLWHQLTFTVHDLGHLGVTHNWAIDRFIGILLADFTGGLSIGWWVDNHNIHHLVTNHPSHDPDIQHMPFFAISTQFLNSLYSSYYKTTIAFDLPARYLLTFQHNLFYIVLSLARFNLYALSYTFLFKTAFVPRKAKGATWSWWMEILGLAFFWTWYTRVLIGCGSWQNALVYLLVSHVVSSPVHVQIVLSHFSRSTEDLGPAESFAHRQLRTTTDVICPPSLGFLHGGLHLQVTHHLFPRLPRHNLRAASKLVKDFAREQGLEYAEFGFVEGNGEVRGVLKKVAEQVRIIGMVADAEVREAVAKATAH